MLERERLARESRLREGAESQLSRASLRAPQDISATIEENNQIIAKMYVEHPQYAPTARPGEGRVDHKIEVSLFQSNAQPLNAEHKTLLLTIALDSNEVHQVVVQVPMKEFKPTEDDDDSDNEICPLQKVACLGLSTLRKELQSTNSASISLQLET